MSFDRNRLLNLLLELATQVNDSYSADRFDYAHTDEIVYELLKLPSIQAHYSKQHLASEVWRQVGQVLGSADGRKVIAQWLTSLRSGKPELKQWLVIGGLIHVRTDEPISIGPITLRPNTQEDIDELLSIRDSHLSTEVQDSNRETIEMWIRHVMTILGGDSLITASVSAGDEGKARELAKEAFEEVIGGLRYLAHLRGLETPIGMRGEALERKLSGLVLVSQQGVTIAIQESPQPDEVLFPSEKVFPAEDGPELEPYLDLSNSERSDDDNLFDKLVEILQIPKATRTDLQNRLLNALRWFGEASIEESHTDAFIKFAISLEALLGQDDPNATITGPLAEKAAFVRGWSSSPQERLGFYKEAKELYGQRSRIVHAGLSPSDSRTASRLESLVSDVLSQFLTQKWLHTYKSWKQFAALFDDLRFS